MSSLYCCVCANVLGTHRSQVRLIQQNGTNEIVVHGNGAITGNETKPIEVDGVIDTQVVIQGESKKEIHLAKGPKFLIDIVAPIDLSSALRAKALIQIDGYMNIPVMKFSAEAHVSLNSDGFRLATVVNYFGVTEVAVTIGFGFSVSTPDLYFQFTKPLEVQLGDITMIGMYKSQTDQTSGPFVEIKGLSAEASTYVSIPLLHVSVVTINFVLLLETPL